MLKLIPFKPDPDGSLGSSGKEEALSQGGSDSAGRCSYISRDVVKAFKKAFEKDSLTRSLTTPLITQRGNYSLCEHPAGSSPARHALWVGTLLSGLKQNTSG